MSLSEGALQTRNLSLRRECSLIETLGYPRAPGLTLRFAIAPSGAGMASTSRPAREDSGR